MCAVHMNVGCILQCPHQRLEQDALCLPLLLCLISYSLGRRSLSRSSFWLGWMASGTPPVPAPRMLELQAPTVMPDLLYRFCNFKFKSSHPHACRASIPYLLSHLPSILRQGLLLKLELTYLPILAAQLVPGICLYYPTIPHSPGITCAHHQVFNMAVRESESRSSRLHMGCLLVL